MTSNYKTKSISCMCSKSWFNQHCLEKPACFLAGLWDLPKFSGSGRPWCFSGWWTAELDVVAIRLPSEPFESWIISICVIEYENKSHEPWSDSVISTISTIRRSTKSSLTLSRTIGKSQSTLFFQSINKWLTNDAQDLNIFCAFRSLHILLSQNSRYAYSHIHCS